MANNESGKGQERDMGSTDEEDGAEGQVARPPSYLATAPDVQGTFMRRPERPPNVTFLAIHTPSPWFEDDPSYVPRLRQFRLVIVQIVAWFLLKIMREIFFSTWSLYGGNMDFFAILFIFLGSHFANVSHNSSNLAATKWYNYNVYIGIGLWMIAWILFGLVVHENIVCAELSKEDFQVLLDCYKMEPQTLGQANLACALGADLKTRATGTCPSLEFKSESQGNAFLFFQYCIAIFQIITIFLNIMDNIKILSVLCELNIEEAAEQLEKKKHIFDIISKREGAKARVLRDPGANFRSRISGDGLRARF